MTDHVQLPRRLANFVGDLGLEVGLTHGGVMPVIRRKPINGEIFVVGDAAGHCLPVTAEGIRIAIEDGTVCGSVIRASLAGALTADEARTRYRDYVHQTDRFQRQLYTMQAIVEHVPESLLALAARACSPSPITHRILTTYMMHSGWRPGRASDIQHVGTPMNEERFVDAYNDGTTPGPPHQELGGHRAGACHPAA